MCKLTRSWKCTHYVSFIAGFLLLVVVLNSNLFCVYVGRVNNVEEVYSLGVAKPVTHVT